MISISLDRESTRVPRASFDQTLAKPPTTARNVDRLAMAALIVLLALLLSSPLLVSAVSFQNQPCGPAPLYVRPTVGVVAVSQAEGLVLLVQKASNDDWEVPKGGLNDTETPVDAVLREWQEVRHFVMSVAY